MSQSGCIKYSPQDSENSNSWQCWLFARWKSLDIELENLSYREVEQTIIYSKKPKMRACDNGLSKVPFASPQKKQVSWGRCDKYMVFKCHVWSQEE